MRRAFKLILVGLFLAATLVRADTAADLQVKIDDRNQRIKALEQEIAGYQKSLDATSKQSASLKTDLAVINTTIKKLNAGIQVTQNKIVNSQATIQSLGQQIGDKDTAINQTLVSLGETLRLLHVSERTSLVEQVASDQSITEFWSNESRLISLQNEIGNQLGALRSLRSGLADKKTATEAEQRKLQALNDQLADQKKIADGNYQAKNKLLSDTKNQESNYRKLMADRQSQIEAFQRELYQFESQLKINIDKSKLPRTGSGVLSWPLDNVFITQYFGRTVDSVRLYLSGSHNGIDLRASVGTPVKSAGNGVVVATGNTDLQPGCYSYGKWVLIDHQNGLSTVYGHLSLIKVTPGQAVTTGQLIGYSGQTGYATGPHLHLSLFATQGVEVVRYTNSLHCKNVSIPLADTKAYLDPMLYL